VLVDINDISLILEKKSGNSSNDARLVGTRDEQDSCLRVFRGFTHGPPERLT
jgi:hypothetical protein